MTDLELIQYYSNLLILQYHSKTKAKATIESLVTPVIMNQLPIAVQNAFDLETAEGVQLDTIGKYVGASRYGNGFSGPITLDDDDFRTLIKLKIVTNSFGSSLAEIQNLLNTYFPGLILVFDYQNMHMSYLLSDAIGSFDLAQIIVTSGSLPKPMAVQLAATIYSPEIFIFFGMTSYQVTIPNNTPFNTYEDYQLTYPWLNYTDALSF